MLLLLLRLWEKDVIDCYVDFRYHDRYHTEIIDEPGDDINKSLTLRSPQRTQGAVTKIGPGA